MNDLSEKFAPTDSTDVVILAGAEKAQRLAESCASAGYRVRTATDAYSAAVELLVAKRAVLAIDFDTPALLRTGLLSLAARKAAAVLNAGGDASIIEGLQSLNERVRPASPAKATETEPAPPDVGEQPAPPAEPDAVHGNQEILTPAELAALLKREP